MALPTVYDFRQATQLSPDQMRALTNQAGSLALIVSRTLQAYLDADVALELEALETTTYEDYVAALPGHVIAGVVDFSGGLPPGLWQVPSALAHAAIDCMLGGRGATIVGDGTGLTPVQAAVLSRFLNDIVAAWAVAWEQFGQLSPRVERVVTSASAAAGAGRIDPQTAHMRLATKIASAEGTMHVGLPVSVMQRILRSGKMEGLPRRSSARDRLTRASIGTHARAFSCDIRVIMPAPQITLRRLLSLQPGDTIDLQCPADEPFRMIVSGRTKFAATPGVSRGMGAARVEHPLSS